MVEDGRTRRHGWVLVGAQFLLIGLCLAPVGPTTGGSRAGAVLVALGAGMAGWALVGLGRDTRVHPVPGSGVELRTRGAYGLVRHPMYGAVLLCCAGAALSSGRLVAWLALACLLAVLVIKARFEDRLLAQRFGAAHAAYAARVPALLPVPRWPRRR